MGKSDFDMLQSELTNLGKWAVETEMKLNPCKSKTVIFSKARAKIK